MAAQIVTEVGAEPPVVGTITLPALQVDEAVTMSNLDDTGVLGWKWEIIDVPALSPTLNPIPADTFLSTRVITPDVVGHSILVELTTYLDVARTILDATDKALIRVRFAPPFDWVIPAAEETIEADEIRGWATDVNRILREVQAYLAAGGEVDKIMTMESGLVVVNEAGTVLTTV